MSEFTRGPLPCQSFTITSPHASPGTPAPLCLSVFSCVLHVCALHGTSTVCLHGTGAAVVVRLAEMANERERG